MINIEFLFCVVGVYVCFLSWGITQERVSTTSYDGQKFKYFILLNTIQSLTAFMIGSLYSLGSRTINMSKDLFLNYLRVSVISTLASPFGYAALKHIDYPTVILGKSCKLVPVMLMNFILYRKTFPIYKYVTVIFISAGVSGFMLLHSQEALEKGSSLWGLCLLGINLFLDGATNSTQDVIFHRFKVTGAHMMTNMNGISFVLMTLYLFFNPWSSELGDGMQFIQSHPSVLRDIFIFALTGALGQLFIFYMLQRFGSLSLVTVTVTRKMFSILLSVFLFGHTINLWQWMAVSVVFMGIGLEAYYSRKEKLEKLQALKKQEDTVYSETQGLLKDEIKSNTPDLDNKLGSPRRSPRKSPKRQVNSPEKVNQADKLADRGLEYVLEASGSNRRRSARLQSRN